VALNIRNVSNAGLQWIELLVVGLVRPSTPRRHRSWISNSMDALKVERRAVTVLTLLAYGVRIGGENRVGDEGMKGINEGKKEVCLMDCVVMCLNVP